MMNIPIAKTVFEEVEFENILKPLRSGWVVQGPFVKEFEDKWNRYTGSRNSIAVSNCTTALHLSLASLGISPGDEVIVPSFTWVASANSIEYLNAKPVLCDIDIRTFNIDVLQIESLITEKTRAIMPVHLFGLSSEINRINEIASKYDLFVVEDAACGFGAKYRGRHVGTFGNTGCFSFHPRKAITTGEGGMITTDDDSLAAKLRSMRDHGAGVSDLQRHLGSKPYLLPDFPYLGYNYRMTDIQASVGSSQMDRAESIHKSRSQKAARYDELIDTISWLEKPYSEESLEHGYQAYVCLFKPEEINLGNVDKISKMRNEFMEYLQLKGISTRPGTHSVHMLDYYRNKYSFKSEDYPFSLIASCCSIALPLFPSLSDSEFEFISETIRRYSL